MTRRKSSGWMVVGTLLVGALLWWLDQQEASWQEPGEYGKSSQVIGPESSGFRRIEGCTLVPHRHNDGDSFHVMVPGGREEEFRLYFVDAPESAVKRYRDGNDNRERLADQARDFGGLSEAETTAVGQEAKSWTARILGQGPFIIYTRGEKVFGGPRLYALVEVREGGSPRWLHELLIEQGLARIHTKGNRLPDGTSRQDQEARLHVLERQAKNSGQGGWRNRKVRGR